MDTYRSQLAETDLGNLLIFDKCPLDFPVELSSNDTLRSIALECCHQFFKQFWELPKPTFRLPREKKIPSSKELTRWDRFARLKGVQKRKKSRKVWDPTTKSWKSRWGRDRINDLKDNWVLEVPDNANPYEDQFEKLAKAKSERKAKNEFQRLRNISRAAKAGQAPPTGAFTESQGSKNELNRALSIAKLSDASMGRFSTALDSRKLMKKVEQKSKNKRANLSQVISVAKKKGVRSNKKVKSARKKGSRTGKKK